MKAQQYFTESGQAKIVAACENGQAAMMLSGKDAAMQGKLISSAIAIAQGDGEIHLGGWHDVVGTLAESVRRYGDKAYPLTEKQLTWVANELNSLFRKGL